MRAIKKAQISIEYLILIGFVLIALIPIFYYATSESSSATRLNEANDAVNILANTANTVYALGPGTKNYVWVTLPGGIESSSIANKRVLVKLHIFGGTSDIYAETKAELVGEIPSIQGTHRIFVEMLETGEVQISKVE